MKKSIFRNVFTVFTLFFSHLLSQCINHSSGCPLFQFKRSGLPDGPKVGSVSLSPRGDWRMPSDAVASLWLAEVDSL